MSHGPTSLSNRGGAGRNSRSVLASRVERFRICSPLCPSGPRRGRGLDVTRAKLAFAEDADNGADDRQRQRYATAAGNESARQTDGLCESIPIFCHPPPVLANPGCPQGHSRSPPPPDRPPPEIGPLARPGCCRTGSIGNAARAHSQRGTGPKPQTQRPPRGNCPGVRT